MKKYWKKAKYLSDGHTENSTKGLGMELISGDLLKQEIEKKPFLLKEKFIKENEKEIEKKDYLISPETIEIKKKKENLIDMNMDGIPDNKNDVDLSVMIKSRLKIFKKRKERKKENIITRERELELEK
ncbi:MULTISPECIES: hypothetical protein [unclassified Fusobacterium]|uniref:hypothetical protein n=1 Tax=unclassified Fusobacterium TaxID=2648384 RepID=UPI001B8AA350|nr:MULTISPECIES: hypothetical protein [unclassified Fusobacterium]